MRSRRLDEDEAEDGDEHDAAAQQRGRRVQPVPLAVGEPSRRRARRGRLSGPVGHSPARLLSASSTSRSRSSAASGSGRPGMTTPVEAAAVTNLRSASPRMRPTGPAVDVDELHPAVRHGDEALEHDAAPEEQVVVAQCGSRSSGRGAGR